MPTNVAELDAHEQPSDELRAKWKAYAKVAQEDIDLSKIDDPNAPGQAGQFCQAGVIPAETLKTAFEHLGGPKPSYAPAIQDAPIYYHPLIPGLLIVPNVMPSGVQKILLGHLLHRDLSNPQHTTNLHLHFKLPYPGSDSPDPSFFSHDPDSDNAKFEAKDPSVHKALSVRKALDRKLHWVTLGGQYDWTNRVYPDGEPPTFPADVAAFIEALFPETRAQAAIVNVYTPGDSMMMHRDVSEETDRGLVSLSLGCDSLFMIAPVDLGKMTEEQRRELPGGKGYLLLRQRSGDAVYMTNEARFAWHGVPKVLRLTCPEYLEDWPACDGKYEGWRGWMKNKRINLNVRQMKD